MMTTLCSSADIHEFEAQRQGIAAQQARKGGTLIAPRRRPWAGKTLAILAVATTVLTLTACGQNDDKTYDIAPIFPLSSDKCAKYDGTVDGTGITAHCYVTKSECMKAATDWRAAMKYIPDAIEFRC